MRISFLTYCDPDGGRIIVGVWNDDEENDSFYAMGKHIKVEVNSK
jgi:hypothetical protein